MGAPLLTVTRRKSLWPQRRPCNTRSLDCSSAQVYYYQSKKTKDNSFAPVQCHFALVAIKLIQLAPTASRLGLMRQPAAENMPQAESASVWQENAVLSRSSQMVGNTAQCYVLAPGSTVSTVNRSHQLALGHQHLQPRAPGYCLSLCAHKYTDGQLPRVLRAWRMVLWVVFPRDHKLKMPHQQSWNHGQLDKVGGAAVCQKQTTASQAAETSYPGLA